VDDVPNQPVGVLNRPARVSVIVIADSAKLEKIGHDEMESSVTFGWNTHKTAI
jgi:hypothetical protein